MITTAAVVNAAALQRLDEHWAVRAVPQKLKARAKEIAKLRLVHSAVGKQMVIALDETPDDEIVIERLAMAYELAAIEGLDAFLHQSTDDTGIRLRQQTQAGAFQAYALGRTLSVPRHAEERIFHVLHLAALAYCGDQWTDLRRWLRSHESEATPPSTADADWSTRVLYRLFDCWVRLLRKRGWDDLDSVREIVAGLREDQRSYETAELTSDHGAGLHATALRLAALYHWAKGTELLAVYMLQGQPVGIDAELDKHFEGAGKASAAAQDPALDMLLKWLHAASRRMVSGSVWRVAHAVNSRVTRFVENVTRTRSMFELLPPQQAALQEQGLLDQASRAVVVDLPTSGGKTALAEFRILQALNQFDAEGGWIAYVAPTRALVSQLTRRLREDFGPLNIVVEQLTGAIEVDAFEEAMLTSHEEVVAFHVLVCTPEKLQLVIRNKVVSRPLALLVMDEAQSMEDQERGLRIELLLATVKRECERANFLLLMPHVPNASDLARWLGADAGRTISIGTSPWQPNERTVGLFRAERDESARGAWTLQYETLTTSPKTLHLAGVHQVGDVRPLDVPFTRVGATLQAGAMAKVFSSRGTSIAVAQQIPHAWSVARVVAENLSSFEAVPEEIALVQRFLATEIGPDFELIGMLSRGVGVHHAGLSDEARNLIEWLAEIGALRVLCCTTTLIHGINFPVSSVFLASRLYPYGQEMSPRAFWNLAGRAGRVDHESVGVVGLAGGDDAAASRSFVSRATGALISRLVGLLDEVEQAGDLQQLTRVILEEQWSDFRCYIAHLWNEKRNLDAVLAETEQLLRNTYGFRTLREADDRTAGQKADALLKATGDYARWLVGHSGEAALADATGFAPEGVAAALAGLNQLEHRLQSADWQPASLFGDAGKSQLAGLVGVMMRIPEIKGGLSEIASHGLSHSRIAEVAKAWVDGSSIQEIATQFFKGRCETDTITNACRAIYRVLVNNGPWGLSALCRMSGIDFDALSAEERRSLNSLPAMMYHGVKTEAGVLMRMNSVPRSIAEAAGREFDKHRTATDQPSAPGHARTFLRSLGEDEWGRLAPRGSSMSGNDYKEIWSRLSGETSRTPRSDDAAHGR